MTEYFSNTTFGYTASGRLVYDPDGGKEGKGEIYPEYYHQDHLGNTRVAFTDRNDDEKVEVLGPNNEVVQQLDYYPFGMAHDVACLFEVGSGENRYRYNGKELNEELGLYDYGARWYDPSIARWHQVDPLAKKGYHLSPYNYVNNNPIRYLDPDGRWFNDANEKRAQRLEKKVEKRIARLERKISKTEDFDKKMNLVGRVHQLSTSQRDIADMRGNTELEFRFAGDKTAPATTPIDSDGKVIEIGTDGTVAQTLHEVRHGGQVARGELGFEKNSDGSWSPDSRYGVADEVSAYKAEYAYDGKLEYQAYFKADNLNPMQLMTVLQQGGNKRSVGGIQQITPSIVNSIAEGSQLSLQHVYQKQFIKPKEWMSN